MSKIVSIKITSAIFLAIVLVAGTITILFPSFMIDAQAQPYYSEMDNRYNSYGPTPEYSSYKPDYKPVYPSYDKKDDRDKSKKDSKSVSINKIKCTTNNIVVNGNNTGNVNIGNNGQVPTAQEGYLDAYSSGSDGYSGERYNDGYDNNKKNKGFTCLIENNNIINNIVAGAGGNATDVNGNETLTCEECYTENLTPELLEGVLETVEGGFEVDIIVGGVIENVKVFSLAELCEVLPFTSASQFVNAVLQSLGSIPAEVPEDLKIKILACIAEALNRI